MKSFAFIVNPITIEQNKRFWPALRIVPNFILKALSNKLPPSKVARIKKIQSIQEKNIEGYLIVLPLLVHGPADEDSVLDKILAAGQVAENLGAKIIGLDGCTSILTDKGYNRLTKRLKIPLTSGNALTCWSVFEAIYRITKIKKINLKKSTLLITGAVDAIGSICARKLSDYGSSVTIADEPQETQRRIKEADIVVTTGDLPDFSIQELKPNAILCALSLSGELRDKAKLRPDLTVIQAGLIKLPFPDKLGIDTGLPADIIRAPLAETMLLTFEEKFVSYSWGENTNPDKLEEIADIAARHGFEVWVPEAPVI